MRAARAAVIALLLSLVFTLLSPGVSQAGPAPSVVPTLLRADDDLLVDSHKGPRQPQPAPVQPPPPTVPNTPGGAWAPPVGVLLNDVGRRGKGRVIVSRVVRAISKARKGTYIRIVTWNLDDAGVVNALIRARHRGVRVQVVVSSIVDNPQWDRLERKLNRKTTDKSFAVQCRGACRSDAGIMHSKIYLFDQIHRVHKISMFGSANLTGAAGFTQWNDLVTLRDPAMFDYFVRVFNEYAQDIKLANPFEISAIGNYEMTLYPARPRNIMVEQFQQVQCSGATDQFGRPRGRTKIRIAIAGWFDDYGDAIARQVRRLWDQGCNIKIITTLSGGGINRVLRASRGRGPIPVREITHDADRDHIPEKYLHLKAVAISGVFAGNTNAHVAFTGSPNWSSRAARSDELLVRMANRRAMVRKYSRLVERLFAGPYAHFPTFGGTPTNVGRLASTPDYDRSAGRSSGMDNSWEKTGKLPAWFEG